MAKSSPIRLLKSVIMGPTHLNSNDTGGNHFGTLDLNSPIQLIKDHYLIKNNFDSKNKEFIFGEGSLFRSFSLSTTL